MGLGIYCNVAGGIVISSYRELFKRIAPFLLVLLLLGIYFGYQKRDQLPIWPSKTPPIPAAIRKGKRQEPLISVYIAEEELVQEMPMEEYVAGVVAGEMDPSWPVEALAAQAILARTFTLQKIAEVGGVPQHNAHASTDIEEFQAFDAEKINDKVEKAVRSTRGMVACYKNNYIRAWFHAYAGPRTALADEGLAFKYNPPYIETVEGRGGKIVPPEEKDWSAEFDLEDVRNAVLEATGKDPGAITEVEVDCYGPSGRVATFLVNGQKISGPSLRLGLESTEMRSTFVDKLELTGENLCLSGTGYGHGVGLCQWGARAMAEEGCSAEEIVQYFYKKIRLVSLWD
ncbi:MAG: SpoIID/LytB domain-containing protein [Firmicutes bacterium]|nr:SpoIID/LytB domain-containing protein [Bacillota bacterium]